MLKETVLFVRIELQDLPFEEYLGRPFEEHLVAMHELLQLVDASIAWLF